MKPFMLPEVSVNETCSEGRTVQYLSDVYRSEFCVKQEDVSELFRLKCAIVCGIREVPANENLQLNCTLGMYENSTHQWKVKYRFGILNIWEQL